MAYKVGQPRNQNVQPPELFRKSKLTDITILVEGQELHFAKYPLMEGSDIFTRMIENGTDQSRLLVHDVSYKDMVIFLECLHPKKFQSITDTNLERVVTVAQQFQHEGILARCNDYVIQQFMEKRATLDGMYTQFFFHLKIAEKCGLKNALEVGLSSTLLQKAYFSSTRKRIQVDDFNKYVIGYENDKDFCDLSSETKIKILITRLKAAESMIPSDKPY